MDIKQYQALDANGKAIAAEAYIDGFNACVNIVESMVVRVGVDAIDKDFLANKKLILDTLMISQKNLINSLQ